MPQTIVTKCVIAGGGPAGMMAGYLLARAGVDVIVLEKHKDFFRDFRGDTIHPSTMQVMRELGILRDFLNVPHSEVRYAEVEFGGRIYRIGDFTHLPVACKFIAFMPQWDFLNFLAEKAKALPHFRLMMLSEATGLLREAGRVTGVRAATPDGEIGIAADLVIAADGRHSTLRSAAGLDATEIGAPMDVLWFRLARQEGEGQAVLGRAGTGSMLVMLDRQDYWQCAFLIRKNGFEALKAQGLDAFRARVAALARRANADEIRSWDDVKLLTVAVNRLERWYQPGLLLIGDAAHAMSPIGGVGINLAIQDAVAAANILSAPLKDGAPDESYLARVQKRRRFSTLATQSLQILIQNRLVDPLLKGTTHPVAPGLVRLLQHWPWLQRLPARVIGLGFRPEHVGLKP